MTANPHPTLLDGQLAVVLRDGTASRRTLQNLSSDVRAPSVGLSARLGALNVFTPDGNQTLFTTAGISAEAGVVWAET